MAAGASTTVSIVVKTVDGGSAIPTAGQMMTTIAHVQANETDSNTANNLVSEGTTLMPDSNAAPTINITSPTTGAMFVGPASINITADANDPDGSIGKVEFYEGDNLIGTGTATSPTQFSFVWSNVPAKSYNLFAVATDNLGKAKVSQPVNIIVNGLASVNITSPAQSAIFNTPANVIVTADASYNGGSISKVDFYAGDVFIGQGTPNGSGQYSFTWNDPSHGTYLLAAVATDGSGVSTTSNPVKVIINSLPIVTITSPATGAGFNAPAAVTITASALDVDGGINKVDFYANGTLIGTGTPDVYHYSYNWSNVAAGNYTLTAVATDNSGATTTSAPVTLRINAPPTVSITSPAAGAQYTSLANIAITANATDDGSVSKVDFFSDGKKIGAGTLTGTNQYSFTWNNVGIGSYALSAIATDDWGITKQSGSVTVKVTSPALLVTGSTTLNSSDSAVKARLEALYHTVTVKDAASATTADANGKALVVISSSVTPTTVGTKFRTVAVPVITWESGLFNNMGMTGSTNKDFGTKIGQTQVSITNPSHPLAAGLSGTATVVNVSGTFDWGKPNANAASIATAAGDTTKTLIFGYEQGAVMPGLTAPARRVGLFMFDDTAGNFNSNGTALLDAAIKWARGSGSLTGSMVASPASTIDLTAQGTFDWAHWALNGPNSFDHKSGVTQQISNFTQIGTASTSWFADCPTLFSWSDGTPTLSIAGTATGVNTNGAVGNGFEITIPADTQLRTLKLYVGVWYAQGKLEATLSDGSASGYTDTSLNNNVGSSFGVYTINFKAGSNAQTLKIRYTIQTQYFSPNGNVALESATLQ